MVEVVAGVMVEWKSEHEVRRDSLWILLQGMSLGSKCWRCCKVCSPFSIRNGCGVDTQTFMKSYCGRHFMFCSTFSTSVCFFAHETDAAMSWNGYLHSFSNGEEKKGGVACLREGLLATQPDAWWRYENSPRKAGYNDVSCIQILT